MFLEQDELFGIKRKPKTAAGHAIKAIATGGVIGAGVRALKKSKAKKTAKRENAAKTIQALAQRDGVTVEDVAMQVVKNRQGEIEKYVVSKGEQPLQNVAELATQAYALRQNDVQNVAQAMDMNEDDALEYIEASEEEAEEYNHPESDQFIGDIFAALKPVAAKGLEKIAAKRAVKGKKPGILGKLSNVLNGGAGVEKEPTILSEAVQAVTDVKKKEEIKKMLPVIIGGTLVLIVVVFLIARATKK